MTPGKDQIVLHASTTFKDALGAYATANSTSMAEVIRKAVAQMIDYNLEAEPARTRTPKYDTPEQAKRAALDRAALIRWGMSTVSKLLVSGEVGAAALIAQSVSAKDYDALTALKATTETGEDEGDSDNGE